MKQAQNVPEIRRVRCSVKFVENEVTFVMWFMYEYAENEITELNRSYDTRLSEEEKKKIFIPTYDCMKKYQGSWHMEQKPAFRNCFLIECRDRDDLADMLHRLQCADIFAENITANAIALLPEQEVFLRNLMMPETKKIFMSTGYIKDGRTYVTKGPLFYAVFCTARALISSKVRSVKTAISS